MHVYVSSYSTFSNKGPIKCVTLTIACTVTGFDFYREILFMQIANDRKLVLGKSLK